MREPIIDLRHVFKQYPLNRYRPSLRHEALRLFRNWNNQTTQAMPDSDFWALRDVSFKVRAGESVGIVGRNGAGKTTLLRILSGITHPTRGLVEVNGRIVPLIGLGAGFDMERSGTENIYLNAAIYGFSAQQTRQLHAAIVEFAELGDFIYQPVKVYSSGMMARLGFSVAIHLAPDILFLDELLSVGDQAFQEKCRERITALKNGGCTLLLVSHLPSAISSLCERALWLQRGQLMMDGPTQTVLDHYQETLTAD
jgi:ABC-type polysaccharide/polyol phosphate transport system ATPase subunit